MMGLEPFQGHIGQGRICPEKDSLFSGRQGGMDTGCDRESDTGRRRFGDAALDKKHNGEKAKHPDSQTVAMVHGAHERIVCFASRHSHVCLLEQRFQTPFLLHVDDPIPA